METAELKSFISNELDSSARLLLKISHEMSGQILLVASLLVEQLLAGRKILIFGNGGSAADAQHFASELAGRYRRERQALPAISLTTDTSLLTAISNDYDFNQVFSRQVEALAQPGDVVIGISTSGRSANIITGLQKAKDLGAVTVALIGANTSELAAVSDQIISIPSSDTPRIQESHAVIIHILCDIVEQAVVDQVPNQSKTDLNKSDSQEQR